jgi:hypothetical protein
LVDLIIMINVLNVCMRLLMELFEPSISILITHMIYMIIYKLFICYLLIIGLLLMLRVEFEEYLTIKIYYLEEH